MNNFKLLAIRPLDNCHERFLKILTPGVVYRFYNTHRFYTADRRLARQHDQIFYFRSNVRAPENLYPAESAEKVAIKVNISAIAGRNGSGKSSLTDLLFIALYTFAVRHEILKPNPVSLKDHSGLQKDMRDIKARQVLLYNEQKKMLEALSDPTFEDLQSIFSGYKNERYLKNKLKDLQEEEAARPHKIAEIEEIFRQLKVEVFYQYDQTVYQLIIDNDVPGGTLLRSLRDYDKQQPSHSSNLDQEVHKKTLANYFFYTIAVNYSHYALNAEVMGNWVNSLFHKNDGYTAPVVINPMRDDGNFDINREGSLAKYRLLSNVLAQKFHARSKKVKITDQQYIAAVQFTLEREKLKKQAQKISSANPGEVTGALREGGMIIGLMGLVVEGMEMVVAMENTFPLETAIMNYIVQKVDRITELYPGFEQGYQQGPDAPTLLNNSFLQSLIDDGTHITNKLLQALNFLKTNLLAPQKLLFQTDAANLAGDEDITFTYTLDQLLDWMEAKDSADIIKKLPPSIFKIDFVLNNPKAKTRSFFSQLSSGEQQLIHTVQSVVYHLNNLQSVHASQTKDRIKYQAINIVYDEVELYFHPALQRRMVAEFLAALKRIHLNQAANISAINILFLTHSPFLLSDIPGENILLLDINKKNGRSFPRRFDSQTFAANINELLADSFFLKGTLMGTHAEKTVMGLIGKINKDQPLNADDEKLLKMIGDDYLRLSIQELEKSRP